MIFSRFLRIGGTAALTVSVFLINHNDINRVLPAPSSHVPSLSQATLQYQNFTNKYLHATVVPGYEERDSPGWDEAYVGFFFGSKYVALMEVTIEAVHVFSDRPILVYVSSESMDDVQSMVPTIWKDRFPRLVLKFMPKSPMHPWFDKLRAILLSNAKRGIIVEADTIITPIANKYFRILEQLPSTSLPVLAPQHPSLMLTDPVGCPFPNVPEACANRFPYPMEKRLLQGQYRHAHIMWADHSKFLFERILTDCIGSDSYQCKSDEAALNVAVWDSNLTVHELCLMDPHKSYWDMYFHKEAQQMATVIQHRFGTRTISFGFVHGCKDPKEASQYLVKLKDIYGTSWKEAREREKQVPWILHNGSMHTTKEANFVATGLTGQECLLVPS